MKRRSKSLLRERLIYRLDSYIDSSVRRGRTHTSQGIHYPATLRQDGIRLKPGPMVYFEGTEKKRVTHESVSTCKKTRQYLRRALNRLVMHLMPSRTEGVEAGPVQRTVRELLQEDSRSGLAASPRGAACRRRTAREARRPWPRF